MWRSGPPPSVQSEMPGMRFVDAARERVLLGDASALREREAMRPEDAVQWWMRHGDVRERSDDGEIVDTTLDRLGIGLDALVIDDALPGGAGTGVRHDPIESDIVD